MEKLSGQVIDFYDDSNGDILKKRFPDPQSLPDIIKEGSFLKEEERDRLRDELFALVLDNGGEHLKKFACTDACNTAISVIYLLDHAKDILPIEAVKTAAANLELACTMYGLDIPEQLSKLAETKVSEISPSLDVTDLEAPEKAVTADRYALKKEARYPIDSYTDAQRAIEYFEKHASMLHPAKRREFSLNITKRADELGIPVPAMIKKYAGASYQDDLTLKGHIALRMEKVGEKKHADLYKGLFEKRGSVTPGVFANMLMEIDSETGLEHLWDGAISDPFTSTLRHKEAGYSYTSSQGYVDEEDLKKLTEFGDLIEKAFGKEFREEFVKKPVDVFKSLPDPEKRTIMKLTSAVKNP